MSRIMVEGLAEDKGEVFPKLPPGRYVAQITNVEDKETKKDKQPMIKLTFTIGDGEHAGRKLTTHLVLPNSLQPVEQFQMSRAKLKRLIVATGLEAAISDLDTTMFMGQTLQLVVTIKTGDDKIERNEVQDFLPVG